MNETACHVPVFQYGVFLCYADIDFIAALLKNKNTLPKITSVRCKKIYFAPHHRLLELTLVVGGLADNRC